MGNFHDTPPDPHDQNLRKSQHEFERLLTAIDNECKRWPQITANIRGERMTLQEKQSYIKSLLQETVNKIGNPASSQTISQRRLVQGQPEQGDSVGERTSQKTDIEQKIQRLLEEKHEKEREMTNLYKQIASLEVEKSLSDTRTMLRRLKDENESLKQIQAAAEKESAKVQRLEQDNSSLKQKLETAINERDDYLERLSKIISKKIRENNPDIVDLSDKYRPTKLGEIYKELYDNEWTDAFEVLTKAGYEEQHAIETLRLTLLDCWAFSQETFTGIVGKIDEVIKDVMQLGDLGHGDEQEVHLQRRLTTLNPKDRREYEVKDSELRRENLLKRWICTHDAQQEEKGEAEEDLQKRLEDIKVVPEDERKKIALMLVPFVQNAYFMTLMTTDGVPEKIKVFINRCLFFCWIAVAQSPPLCLDNAKSGSHFDQKLYREYTRRGKTVEFLVWPALKLHKGGPFLTKGVAQASRAGTEN